MRLLLALLALAACGAPISEGELGATRSRLTAAATPPPYATFAEQVDHSTWQRGQLHAHTTRYDGSATPEQMVTWYRDNGFAFLSLSEHGIRIDPEPLRHLERPGFVLLPAEELSPAVRLVAGGPALPAHMQGVCTTSQMGNAASAFTSKAAMLSWGIGKVAAANGIGIVNHPNFYDMWPASELTPAASVPYLEIWSGHTGVGSDGTATMPSVETTWQQTLDMGMDFAPVAVDDSHSANPAGGTGPGKAWVQVAAPETTEAAICAALRARHMYASNGPSIARIHVGCERFAVTLGSAGRVDFIGTGGAVLATHEAAAGDTVSYRLQGSEPYVRARVTSPTGRRAWTRAYRTRQP